jgi:medium-chain acyl-[acyl-carrier-protein] hydrolase
MGTTSRNTGWVKLLQPNSQAKLRLFCLPYAGGWSQIYRPWVDSLSPEIELYAIELPGRGPRLSEAPITDLSLLVEQIAINIYAHLDRPFAFFGHSMGGLLCFELTKLLRGQGYPEPEHLFISGYRAPHLRLERTPVYNLPEPEFIEKVRRMEGTPDRVLANAELRELIFPALRADFQAIETYRYLPSASLSCPMTVFGGLQDVGVDVAMLEGWQQHTTGKFRLQLFNGNHFFLHEAQALMLQSIQQQLFGGASTRLDMDFEPLNTTPEKSVSLRSSSK